jgi:hypothetical protein
VSYEDSGHQPSRVIKKVLERTSIDASEFVTSVKTTYRNPDAAEACKLEAHSDPGQIRFQISDGQELVCGYFSTVATSLDEQSVVLRFVKAMFYTRCNNERLRVSDL